MGKLKNFFIITGSLAALVAASYIIDLSKNYVISEMSKKFLQEVRTTKDTIASRTKAMVLDEKDQIVGSVFLKRGTPIEIIKGEMRNGIWHYHISSDDHTFLVPYKAVGNVREEKFDSLDVLKEKNVWFDINPPLMKHLWVYVEKHADLYDWNELAETRRVDAVSAIYRGKRYSKYTRQITDIFLKSKESRYDALGALASIQDPDCLEALEKSLHNIHYKKGHTLMDVMIKIAGNSSQDEAKVIKSFLGVSHRIDIIDHLKKMNKGTVRRVLIDEYFRLYRDQNYSYQGYYGEGYRAYLSDHFNTMWKIMKEDVVPIYIDNGDVAGLSKAIIRSDKQGFLWPYIYRATDMFVNTLNGNYRGSCNVKAGAAYALRKINKNAAELLLAEGYDCCQYQGRCDRCGRWCIGIDLETNSFINCNELKKALLGR